MHRKDLACIEFTDEVFIFLAVDRGWIGWVHTAMTPPPVQILESLFGILDRRVKADPERLERIVRFAVARGWLRFDRSLAEKSGLILTSSKSLASGDIVHFLKKK